MSIAEKRNPPWRLIWALIATGLFQFGCVLVAVRHRDDAIGQMLLIVAGIVGVAAFIAVTVHKRRERRAKISN